MTGADGFIGSHLTEDLVRAGAQALREIAAGGGRVGRPAAAAHAPLGDVGCDAQGRLDAQVTAALFDNTGAVFALGDGSVRFVRETIAALRPRVPGRLIAVFEPRSNTMKLGVMRAALPETRKPANL